MIRRPLTRREYEILQLALRNAADLEKMQGNTLAAQLLTGLQTSVVYPEDRGAA